MKRDQCMKKVGKQDRTEKNDQISKFRSTTINQSNRYILPKDFYPRFFVDITEFQSKKFEALNFYRGSHDRMGKLFGNNKKSAINNLLL